MPAPPNTSLATATDLGTLSGGTANTITQDIRDSGTNYTVWFRYTAVPGDNVIGVFPFGDLTDFGPTITVYLSVGITLLDGLTCTNKPIQFPVTAGTTYYFRIQPTGAAAGHSTLTLSIRRWIDLDAPAGSLVINDDTDGFPAAILSATDGSVLRFVQGVCAGEALAVLPTAQRFLASAGTTDSTSRLLDVDLTELVSVAFDSDTSGIQAHPDGNFYAGNPNIGAHATIQRIMSDGTLTSNWALGSAGLTTFALNLAASVVYYTVGASAIHRWDLGTSSALPDFAAELTGYSAFLTPIVLADDSLIVGYAKTTVTRDVLIRRYDAAGAILHTYSLGSLAVFDCRLAPGSDDSSFWLWRKFRSSETVGGEDRTGWSRFTQLQVSDGTTLAEFDVPQYEDGRYQGVATATPGAYFGHSESCHLAVLPASGPAVTGTIAVTIATGQGASAPSLSARVTGIVRGPRRKGDCWWQ